MTQVRKPGGYGKVAVTFLLDHSNGLPPIF